MVKGTVHIHLKKVTHTEEYVYLKEYDYNNHQDESYLNLYLNFIYLIY